MADINDAIKVTDLTFEEAQKYFGNRLVVTPQEFAKIAEEYRSLAFTVGNYTKIQVLKKFHEELLSSIENGTTLKQFRENMNDFLTRHGYEGVTKFQADNIFRTNIQTAYNVGHYRQMTKPEVKKLRPYWLYDAVNDTHTRPAHLAMDGKVFPADSDVWNTWYPPNGFRCRCGVVTLSREQVEARGLKVEDKMPAQGLMPDGRVGQIVPDPNFSSNPAKNVFEPDLKGYPDVLKKAYRRLQKS